MSQYDYWEDEINRIKKDKERKAKYEKARSEFYSDDNPQHHYGSFPSYDAWQEDYRN